MKMKTLISSVLLLCIFTAACFIGFAALWPVPEAEGASVPKCHLYEKIPGCTRDFNPVCGTDGKTYSNECMLCSSNRDNGLKVQVKWNGAC